MPQQFADGFASGGTATLNQVGGVGDLGATILAAVPPAQQAQVEPLIPAIVAGIHNAFSLATASTFVIGIVTCLIAAFVVLVLMPAGRMGESEEAVPMMLEPETVPVED